MQSSENKHQNDHVDDKVKSGNHKEKTLQPTPAINESEGDKEGQEVRGDGIDLYREEHGDLTNDNT